MLRPVISSNTVTFWELGEVVPCTVNFTFPAHAAVRVRVDNTRRDKIRFIVSIEVLRLLGCFACKVVRLLGGGEVDLLMQPFSWG